MVQVGNWQEQTDKYQVTVIMGNTFNLPLFFGEEKTDSTLCKEKTTSVFMNDKTVPDLGEEKTASEFNVEKTDPNFGEEKTISDFKKEMIVPDFGEEKTTFDIKKEKTAPKFGMQNPVPDLGWPIKLRLRSSSKVKLRSQAVLRKTAPGCEVRLQEGELSSFPSSGQHQEEAEDLEEQHWAGEWQGVGEGAGGREGVGQKSLEHWLPASVEWFS